MAVRLTEGAMLAQAVWTVRAFYIFSSLAILAVQSTPAFADRFLAYGARARPAVDSKQNKKQRARQNEPRVGIKTLDYLATLTVPHSWFKHFYILSFICSLSFSCILCYLHFTKASVLQGQNFVVAAFCSYLMLWQGLRRLLECIYVTQPSRSRMWIGHYVIGMAFYLVTNIAIWIDHVKPNGKATNPIFSPTDFGPMSGLWTLRIVLCTLAFFAASYKQNQFHRYLSSLKKYTLPKEGAFRSLIAPHYTMECVIYLVLSILDAPYHEQKVVTINWTLFCALLFVAVNLGVTADGTKKWQGFKFRDNDHEITKKWRMIPLVF